MWEIIQYGGFLYVQSFMNKFSLRLSFLVFFYIAMFVTHCYKLKMYFNSQHVNNELLICAPISQHYNNLGCYSLLIAHFFKKKLSPNIYKNTLKMCCNEECQIVTPFCLHHTMETIGPQKGFFINENLD
jgi:hypothetical protein